MVARNSGERQTLTVEEAAAVLGIGRNSAYQAVASGQLPVLRIGRRLLVPRAALERLLAETRAAEQKKPVR
jgi:excisionase family DNA binding protein